MQGQQKGSDVMSCESTAIKEEEADDTSLLEHQ